MEKQVASFKEYWVRLFCITICFYKVKGSQWRINKRKTMIQDGNGGVYVVLFVLNTPLINFCISNYLNRRNDII